ncbi:GTPase Era family protein [Skeletonema marinoi]|uniref:GTPase Era family protein n=1 Tax=Skeletonema marinoi TaxID=267567 RepID=A0AAD8YBL5_9STRA|nr:GTPase Era family protein [Skeletonema marinoi]
MMALRGAICRGGTNVARSAVNRLLPPPHCHHQPPYCCRRIHATTYAYTSADENTSSRQDKSDQRNRLDVAIVGAPNAGKSQLLNSLMGMKVAAVSRKRHTTRTGIFGARTFDDTQIVFIDTPGYLHHEMSIKEGVRKLLGEASSEIEASDYVVMVVDAAKKLDEDMKRTLITLIFLALRSRGRNEDGVTITSNSLNKFAVVLNKVDLVSPKQKLLLVVSDVSAMADSCIRRLLKQRRSPTKTRLESLVNDVLKNYAAESGFDGIDEEDLEDFAAIVPDFLFTSAITKDDEGVDDVLNMLLDKATPSNEWIIDPETGTAMSPLEQIEEILREKIYRCLHREVPHAVQQQNRLLRLDEKSVDGKGAKEDSGDILRIRQDLVVRTKSHQRLVMGSGGKTLERIRSTAIKDLETAFQCKVDLTLSVRVTKSDKEIPLDSESTGGITYTPN